MIVEICTKTSVGAQEGSEIKADENVSSVYLTFSSTRENQGPGSLKQLPAVLSLKIGLYFH